MYHTIFKFQSHLTTAPKAKFVVPGNFFKKISKMLENASITALG
jgi:hypothetical protein